MILYLHMNPLYTQTEVFAYVHKQCASGSFSASGATVCTACSAGKYLTDAAGGTDAASCTMVSLEHIHRCVC